MITCIEAHRYRCFERLSVPLGGYTVLVGRNGAGKSTLIDIPVVLGEMLQRQSIHSAFFSPTPSHPRARADGAQDLVFNRAGPWFALAVEVSLPDEVRARAGSECARYELAFSVEGSALSLSQEALILFDKRPAVDELPQGLWATSHLAENNGTRIVLSRERGGRTELSREPRLRGPKPPPTVFDAASEAPALAFVPPDAERHPAATWLRAFLGRECVLYQPSLTALRSAQPSPGRDFRIAPDAGTLAWSVLRLAAEDSVHFKEWNEHVESALPNLERVEARQREDDQFAYLRVHYRNGLVVPGHGLSDGTLAVLAYTILPYLANVPRFLAIEEPENGIHPKAIEAVLETLQVIDGTQVWVTTHSPIVAAVTELRHLLCLGLAKTGGVEAVPGTEHSLLAHWHGQPSLGTLHSAGVL
ncbi:MAG: AAA family ATPase [Verrucomicrobiales bacterium]|nr:AAA family ATPase [Verrucomicrobiales bacterium]